MRVRLNDPESALDLAEFLRARVGAVVEPRNNDSELEVSLLGSYGEEAMRGEVQAAVRRWTLVRQRPETLVDFV